MNLPSGLGAVGGAAGIAVFVVVYVIVLVIGLWIGYLIMRRAVTKGVLKALEKSGITRHGRIDTLAVTSETRSTATGPRPGE